MVYGWISIFIPSYLIYPKKLGESFVLTLDPQDMTMVVDIVADRS